MSDESKCPICKGEVEAARRLRPFVLLNAARDAYGDPTLQAEFFPRRSYEDDAHPQGFSDGYGPVYGFWSISRRLMPDDPSMFADPTAGHTRHATELGAIREALVLKGIDPDNLREKLMERGVA